MEKDRLLDLFKDLPTPAYVIDEAKLIQNAEILASVIKNTGCKILLAQKAFSNYDFYPLLGQYISGTAASGLFEARLGAEEMPDGEVHVFSGAYRDDEFKQVLHYASHIVFNSVGQLKRLGPKGKALGKSLGLRVNPEKSTQEGPPIYDPCAPGSRLGVTREAWDQEMDDETLALLDGIHFHTLCEQGAEPLEVTLETVEEKFGDILPQMKWLNMGGGHHITRADYNVGLLESLIKEAQAKWQVQVYLEPGEAVALDAGYLASRVLDLTQNAGIQNAILDTSAACHMPDVIEMPYIPPLMGAGKPGAKAHAYRLGGATCLSGDIIGDFSFDDPLQIGDMVIFSDMAIYTTCKNNTFNGMPLPNIYKMGLDGSLTKLTHFGYQDFKMRLGK